ncbi:MAG: ABC transporter permease subunit [Nitrososphaerota archaeon]|nr:ABC transporter permease subunit [Candidatus Bathyarchaeota archaeon]MDW8022943.1 ABC transporter permease subunit [Nitrososphaerota archaeon]
MLVFRKDWWEIRRNWQVILPMVAVPLMISVLLPAILAIIPNLTPETSPNDFEAMIKNLPESIQEKLKGMTQQQAAVYIMAIYLFAPLFLIIPIMASSVIASDSFAGEKERKTIEALLATPISDSELFLGKILVSFIPSMAVTIASFIVYSIMLNVLFSSTFNGELLFPNWDWILLVFCLAPTMALSSIGLTVMVSVKVKGFREAQQISAVLLIPILALIFGQITGALMLGTPVITALIGAFAIIDLLIFKIGVKIFEREEILSKLA